MANMLKMMKQVKELRKMQKNLEKQTTEATSKDGLITVVATGDMSVKSIKIDPSAIDSAKIDKLEKLIAMTVNSALDASKKAAAQSMASMTGGMGGLGDMLGG